MLNVNKETRINAFDHLCRLKNQDKPREETIKEIFSEFHISKTTLYQWHAGHHKPWGRKGRIKYVPELFYTIGALLGDGCFYNWRITNNYLILVGDQKFTNKYAQAVAKCTGEKVVAYINRGRNVWFVRTNNFELYSLFKKSRENITYLKRFIKQGNKKSIRLFIEGFFDAEGCVKIIKEKTRKTPKICLDITNTNQEILDLIKKLLKNS